MSLYYSILSGVQNSVSTTGISTVLRDDLFLLEGDVLPLVIVAPGPEFETIRLQTFNKNIVYDYHVLIAYIIAGNRIVSSNLQTFLDNRETIRNKLYQIGVSGITAWDTKMQVGPVSKFQALVGSNYKVTGWTMAYSGTEIRQGV